MNLLKKIIPFVIAVATVFSGFGVQNTFADSQIKKGSTRVVMFENEIDPCEDEVVYQGHRYLPAEYFVVPVLGIMEKTFILVIQQCYMMEICIFL